MILEIKFLFLALFFLGVLCIIVVGGTTNIIATDVWVHKTFSNPNTSIWSKYVMPATLGSFVMMWVAVYFQWSIELYAL